MKSRLKKVKDNPAMTEMLDKLSIPDNISGQ